MSANFEAVCETCPLRALVDIERCGMRTSMGSDGYSVTLSDGNDHATVNLKREPVYSTSQLPSISKTTNERIEGCSGPDQGVLRSHCGAGLASAWRWANTHPVFRPNVGSPEDIAAVFKPATFKDALPKSNESTRFAGDLRDFSELDCDFRSGYTNLSIRKLGQPIVGTTAKLPQDRAVMLDVHLGYLSDRNDSTVYRLRIAQAGPEFLFEVPLQKKSKAGERQHDYDKILSRGLFTFLNSTKTDLDHSHELAVQIYLNQQKREEDIAKFFGGLSTSRNDWSAEIELLPGD